jgi:hypothetical protein
MKKVFAVLSLVLVTQASFAQDDSDFTVSEGTLKVSNSSEVGSVITLGGDLAAALSTNMKTQVHTQQSFPGGFVACVNAGNDSKSPAKCVGLSPDISAPISNEFKVSALIVDDYALAFVVEQDAVNLAQSMKSAIDQDGFLTGKNIVCMIEEKIEDNMCMFGMDMTTGNFITTEQVKTMNTNSLQRRHTLK